MEAAQAEQTTEIQIRPVGRPSKYDPEYHPQEAMRLGLELGYSPAQIATNFDVDRKTLYDWAKAHTEFSTALKRAHTYAQAWWEAQAQSNLKNRNFAAPVWKKSMEARFREDYTERREDTTTVKADDSIAAVMGRIAAGGRPSQDA